MTYLSDAEKATLRTLFAGPDWSGLDDAARFARLNAPSAVANPEPQGSVPAPFTVSAILGALSAESRAKLVGVAFVAHIRDDIVAQDRAACALWAQLLAAGTIITPDEMGALIGILSATMPDPDWAATAPGPSPARALFGGKTWTGPDGSQVDYVTLADVEASR